MISVEEAQALCLGLVQPTQTFDEVELAEAAGRVLRVPAKTHRAQPPFPSSAMDGYAVRSVEMRVGASFTVVGEAAAGRGWKGTLSPNQAVRIFTGAPVPEGADHVVIQEDVTRDGEIITVLPSVGEGANIRPLGTDFPTDFTLPSPRILSPSDLALLAAMNVPKVKVSKRPKVAFLATGDELVMPGEAPSPDQIIASNIFALKAIVEAAGGEGFLQPIAPDDEDALQKAIEDMMFADIAVTIGGASVGEYDLVGKAAENLGLTRAFYKIAMRPGKPLIAGSFGKSTAYLGLPGNPVSAIVCAHIFLVPMIRRMLGLTDVLPKVKQAKLGKDITPNGPRQHYMRAIIEDDILTPFDRQDSSLLSVLVDANALLIRPIDDPARPKGDLVSYLLLD